MEKNKYKDAQRRARKKELKVLCRQTKKGLDKVNKQNNKRKGLERDKVEAKRMKYQGYERNRGKERTIYQKEYQKERK